MGVTKSQITYSHDGTLELPDDHTLPGYTVDSLLKQGKIEEAREELERLIQKGIDSGPGIEVTPQFWEDVRAEVRRRAKAHE